MDRYHPLRYGLSIALRVVVALLSFLVIIALIRAGMALD